MSRVNSYVSSLRRDTSKMAAPVKVQYDYNAYRQRLVLEEHRFYIEEAVMNDLYHQVSSGGDSDTKTIPTTIINPNNLIGNIWYSTGSTDWYDINNWFASFEGSNLSAAFIPNASSEVELTGGIAPVIDLDNPNWVEPVAIRSMDTDIEFHSEAHPGNALYDCILEIPNVTFSGTAIYHG